MKTIACLLFACCGLTAIAAGQETRAPQEPIVYQFKPNHMYRYDFELRSGEDGDGFLQLDGNVSYTFIAIEGLAGRPPAGRPSLIDEAFKGSGGGKVSGQPVELSYFGSVTSKDGQAQRIDGAIRVAPRGETSKSQGQTDYSLVTTSVGALAFDELPPAGQTKWQAERTRKAVFVDEAPAGLPGQFSLFRYGRYLPSYRSSPLLPRTTVSQMDIEDKITYELTELTDETAVVKTRLVSSWASAASGKKTVELESSGQYTFDRGQNVIAKGHSQTELKVTTEGIEARLPLKMAFVLREVVSTAELKERVAKNEAKRQQDSQQQVTQAIAVLKDSSSQQAAVRDALQALAHPRGSLATARREEVAALLNKFLTTDDETTRSAAVRAAEDWATATNIPALLELLKTEQSYRRGGIIQALGATGGNAAVAGVLARLMESSSTRFYAAQALKKMGAQGEPVVLPLLKSTDRGTRDDACEVLGEIGGKKSKAALEALLANSSENDFQHYRAKSALDKIKERLAADPD